MNKEPRLIRLLDLQDHHVVIITCVCGRLVRLLPGMLQRWHKMPSDTLLYDLQFRLRCRICGRREGFGIAVADTILRERLPESNPLGLTIIVDGNGKRQRK